MRFVPEYDRRKLNGIYIIRNTIDSRVYIGECHNFYKRYGRHKSSLLLGKHCNIKLQNFVNKYGIEALEFDILELCDDNLVDKEIEYIKKYDSINNGFNIILDSRTMAHVTNDDRRVGKEKLRGIKRDQNFCDKVKVGIREYYKNNPKKKRARWTEERKEQRKKYIAEHPERYANRKSSSGNRKNHARGEDKGQAKVTSEVVYLIKLNIKNGVKRSITLSKYGISVNIYKDIQRGKTWKHINVD